MSNGHLSLGKANCGWQQHLPVLDAFARACESDTQDTISLILTDDTYIGIACFSIGGSYKQLDAATFKRWERLCQWKCSYEPDHRGSPCLLVHVGIGTRNVSRIERYTIEFLQLAGVFAIIWLCSCWVEQQTPPEWCPVAMHEFLSAAHSIFTNCFAQQIPL
jgi:hypothetical protein